MLMLVDWTDPAHSEAGVAFAKHCRRTLLAMSRDEGI